jgi:ubiquitin-protein ligase E3 D
MGTGSIKGLVGLQCSECKGRLGTQATNEGSYRIYKSRVAISQGGDQSLEKHAPAVFISAQLLSIINSSVSRKVVVHSGGSNTPSDQKGLLLWVFNPDIYYSSSQRGPTAYRAMKIFYKTIDEPARLLDGEGASFEELIIPEGDFESFTKSLTESTEILPDSAGQFQEWTVGLLDRWEKDATGSARMDENPLNKKLEEGFETFKLPAGMQELYL